MRRVAWGLLPLLTLWAGAATELITPPATPTTPAAPPGILFLHLRLTTNLVRLDHSTVVPGTLKPRRGQPGPDQLVLTLQDAAGNTLWTERLRQPWTTRLEYEDPDHPGELKAIVQHQPEASVVARVPALREARRLTVHRTLPAPEASTVAVPAPPLARVLVGVLDLPPEVLP